MRRDRMIQLFLFVFFLALYLLASGDHFKDLFYSSDETLMAKTTISIVEDGSLRIPETFGTTTPKFGVLQSVAAIPFYLAARKIVPHLPREAADPTTVLLLYCTCPVIAALLLAGFYGFSRQLRYPRPAALAATLALGLATCLFPYAKMFFSEPLVALALLGSVFQLTRPAGRVRSLFWSGLWLGLAVLARSDNLLLLPVFLMVIAMAAARRRNPPRYFIRGVAAFSLPLFGALAVQLAVNALRFGSPWRAGYGGEEFSTPLAAGLFGLLLSPGRGLLIYSPPLLIVPFVLGRFFRRRALGFAVLGIFTIKLLLFAKWWSWQGGWCWGSRFLLPAIPLLFLSLNELFLRWRRIHWTLRGACLALFGFGFAVQCLGVLVNPNKHGNDIWSMIGTDENQLLFVPQLSALAGNWQLARAGFIDSFVVHFAEYYGRVPLAAILGVLLAALALSAAGLAKTAGLSPRLAAQSLRLSLDTWSARALAALAALNVLIFVLCFTAVGANHLPFSSTAENKPVPPPALGQPHPWPVQDRTVAMEECWTQRETSSTLPLYTWQGWLLAPNTGDYLFHIKASGFYQVTIGGNTILNNQRETEQHVRGAATNLTKGTHSIRVSYRPVAADYRLLRLYWTVPGGGIYRSLLTNRWIFAEPPSPLLLGLLKLDEFKIFILALSLLAACAIQWIASSVSPSK